MKLKVVILALIVTLQSCYLLSDDRSSILPEKIEVSDVYRNKISSGISEGCGAVIFTLTEEILEEINNQGLIFFNDATRARGSTRSNSRYYLYQRWQGTPLKQSANNTNFWAGMSCAKNLGLEESLYEEIVLAMRTTGSYYTGHYEGQLVVIPRLGLVVFSYAG
ncbi:hypothetical protein [Synechococcus sp. PCC 7336]|uniref:hypothetical protein n=1 Tax=Synechococcus sp. PCC 7336 TaxID=195250 RepID=UPI0012EAFA93|nr:hypothetical protein [Synechococcus sp. PCC 7336]